MAAAYQVHPSAIVEQGSEVGAGTKIWHFVHVRSGARIGEQCVIGKGVYVDSGVIVGNRVKVQNHVSLFDGVEVADGVFIGPHVCFTNDLNPRAINPDGTAKAPAEWRVDRTRIEYGASIGANATIIAGVVVGKWALVGAGAVVTKAVPPYALVLGNPARIAGVVAPTGEVVSRRYAPGEYSTRDRAVSFRVE